MKRIKITKDLILNWIKEYYNEHGDFPVSSQFKTIETCPFSWNIIYRYFNNFGEACKAATGQDYARKNKPIEINCKNCNKIFKKKICDIKKTPNSFCSRSCSTTYNNTHKKYGHRRSKIEKLICDIIRKEYPNIKILENSKELINFELDIYLPELKLAIELNGPTHYEPIYRSR